MASDPHATCPTPFATRRRQGASCASDKSEQRRVLAAIDDLADDPRPTGCKKLSGHESLWRIRVGPFRVVYRIDDENLLRVPVGSESFGYYTGAPPIVLVLIIGHRRDVYEAVKRL